MKNNPSPSHTIVKPWYEFLHTKLAKGIDKTSQELCSRVLFYNSINHLAYILVSLTRKSKFLTATISEVILMINYN